MSEAPRQILNAWGSKMEFGDRRLFAVQIELDQSYCGPWLFGRFCYWINATEIGNYGLGTSLRDLFHSMKWFVSDSGNRHEKELCGLPAEAVFERVDRELYGGDWTTSSAGLIDTPARFDITPNVDVFDDWKIFLVECSEHERFIYRKASRDRIESFEEPKGVFSAVIKETYDYLEQLYDSESQ